MAWNNLAFTERMPIQAKHSLHHNETIRFINRQHLFLHVSAPGMSFIFMNKDLYVPKTAFISDCGSDKQHIKSQCVLRERRKISGAPPLRSSLAAAAQWTPGPGAVPGSHRASGSSRTRSQLSEVGMFIGIRIRCASILHKQCPPMARRWVRLARACIDE